MTEITPTETNVTMPPPGAVMPTGQPAPPDTALPEPPDTVNPDAVLPLGQPAADIAAGAHDVLPPLQPRAPDPLVTADTVNLPPPATAPPATVPTGWDALLNGDFREILRFPGLLDGY